MKKPSAKQIKRLEQMGWSRKPAGLEDVSLARGRARHLEKFCAAFILQAGGEEAAKALDYELQEILSADGLTITWRFQKRAESIVARTDEAAAEEEEAIAKESTAGALFNRK